MPDPLSPNLQHLKASETVAISNEAKRRKAAGEDVIDLGVGEPDFDTPAPAAQAGIQAIQKGLTRYPPNVGTAELRRAIAGQLSRMSGGRAVDPDNIIVSSGSKQSIFNACFSLFGPKDRVLIPAPAWVSYPQIVHLCRAEPVLVPGDLEWGLKVSARDLDKQSNKATRGLILCSPCNPTGAVYTLAELRSIAEWAAKNDVWIISDEIYRRINYGPGPAASLLDLPDELLERVVVIYGASKAYAMTGWRIGAALAPPHLTKAMAALQSHTTTGANQPASGRPPRLSPTTRWTRRWPGWSRHSAVAATTWCNGSVPRHPVWSSSSPTAPSTSSSGWTVSGSRIPSPAARSASS